MHHSRHATRELHPPPTHAAPRPICDSTLCATCSRPSLHRTIRRVGNATAASSGNAPTRSPHGLSGLASGGIADAAAQTRVRSVAGEYCASQIERVDRKRGARRRRDDVRLEYARAGAEIPDLEGPVLGDLHRQAQAGAVSPAATPRNHQKASPYRGSAYAGWPVLCNPHLCGAERPRYRYVRAWHRAVIPIVGAVILVSECRCRYSDCRCRYSEYRCRYSDCRCRYSDDQYPHSEYHVRIAARIDDPMASAATAAGRESHGRCVHRGTCAGEASSARAVSMNHRHAWAAWCSRK